MRWLGMVAVVAALLSPTVASGQNYTFGDWARDEGYSPGDVMPDRVWAGFSGIESLDGIGEFDWATTPTTELYLDFNQLSGIEPGVFSGLTNLTTLYLENNLLLSLESGAFSGLANLETLNLGFNQLSSIESGAFNELTNLIELDLYDNQLSGIEPGTFNELTNLTKLDLDFNQLSGIEPGVFSGLTNLTRLDLENNGLLSLESGAFSGLTNLTTLRLSMNQLSRIESGVFSGLTNLIQLGLYDNQLSSIEPGTFNELTNLTELSLGSNRLSSIESGAFSGLTNLTGLDLYGNQISSIESGDFTGLTNLTELWLNSNQLSSIESGAFSGLPDLKLLFLSGNTALTELNLANAEFSSLLGFNVSDNVNIASVSLRNTVMNQRSLANLFGGGSWTGIGELDATITEMDLSGIDFVDITDLEPLYVMDDLTDLWLVNTQNVDATDLDVLLDNLETIEGTDTEGILYMTEADFDAFNTAGGGLLAAWHGEPGHHVAFVIPEPSTFLLCIIALAVVGGWRKWKRATWPPCRPQTTGVAMNRLSPTTALAVLLLLSTSAQAALLMLTDANSPGGANNVTRDTDTRLDWLDWVASVGISYNGMRPMLAVGQPYVPVTTPTRVYGFEVGTYTPCIMSTFRSEPTAKVR